MDSGIKEKWYAFELEEFPPQCLGRSVEGMNWEQVDAVAAACISTYIQAGKLDRECIVLLDQAVIQLSEITAVVEEEHKGYFGKLLEIAREVREEGR